MFERYTEKARRTIFFARYEASRFGCSYIETEHLLLGLFREDKALVSQSLGSHDKIEAVRHLIEQRAGSASKIATSVDPPLSQELKRVLAYAAEESERMNHKYIGTPDLLLGLLREKKSFAAQLLREQGLSLESAREQVRRSEPPQARRVSASMEHLRQWLAEREARGGIWIVEQKRLGPGRTDFAVYAGDPPEEKETKQDTAPAETLAQIQKRIEFIIDRMERAIAGHEFEKARLYSEEERKERENLRMLREQFDLEEPPPVVPLLCIEILRDESLSEVQECCENYIGQGVAGVLILDPNSKRAYKVNSAEGLREFKGEIFRMANPPLEMDLRRVFD